VIHRDVGDEREDEDDRRVEPAETHQRPHEQERADREVELIHGIHGFPGVMPIRRLKKLFAASPAIAPKPIAIPTDSHDEAGQRLRSSRSATARMREHAHRDAEREADHGLVIAQ